MTRTMSIRMDRENYEFLTGMTRRVPHLRGVFVFAAKVG